MSSAIEAHPSDIFRRHSLPSLSSSSDCQGRNIKDILGLKKTVTNTNSETSCQKHPEKFVQYPTVYLSRVRRPDERKQEVLFRIFQARIVTWLGFSTKYRDSSIVPRLVEKPNCVQVPKEICFEVKTNPRKVSKKWCYRPQDFRDRSSKEALDLVLNKLNEEMKMLGIIIILNQILWYHKLFCNRCSSTHYLLLDYNRMINSNIY